MFYSQIHYDPIVQQEFIDALKKNDITAVSCLIKNNAVNVNKMSESAETPLKFVAEKGRLDMLRILLTAPDICINNNVSHRPLYAAVMREHLPITHELLSDTRIQYIEESFLLAIRLGHIGVLREFMQHCTSDRHVIDLLNENIQAIHYAIKIDNSAVISVVLEHYIDFTITHKQSILNEFETFQPLITALSEHRKLIWDQLKQWAYIESKQADYIAVLKEIDEATHPLYYVFAEGYIETTTKYVGAFFFEQEPNILEQIKNIVRPGVNQNYSCLFPA